MRATKPLLTILLLIFILPQSFSQGIIRQSINSFGTSSFTEGYRISETVGQPYVTLSQKSGSLVFHPGFQQQMIAGKKEITMAGDHLRIEFFPNPASSFLYILPSEVIPEARITVVDMSGKIISETKHFQLETAAINVSDWTPGLYSIRVVHAKTMEASSTRILIIK